MKRFMATIFPWHLWCALVGCKLGSYWVEDQHGGAWMCPRCEHVHAVEPAVQHYRWDAVHGSWVRKS